METAVEPVIERTTVQWLQRVLLGVLLALFLVLLATGLWLVFRYQPNGSFRGSHPESVLRRVHRITSVVFTFLAIATFAVSIAVSIERRLRRGVPAWVIGLVLMLGVVTAGISGYLLPWDQLALTRVRANSQIHGFGFLFGNSIPVRFVLIGGSEVSKATVRAWFLVHTALFPVAVLVLGVILARVTRRARLAERPPA